MAGFILKCLAVIAGIMSSYYSYKAFCTACRNSRRYILSGNTGTSWMLMVSIVILMLGWTPYAGINGDTALSFIITCIYWGLTAVYMVQNLIYTEKLFSLDTEMPDVYIRRFFRTVAVAMASGGAGILMLDLASFYLYGCTRSFEGGIPLTIGQITIWLMPVLINIIYIRIIRSLITGEK